MSLIFVDLWYFSFLMTYTWSQDFQSFILLSTAATQRRCSNNGRHYSVSTKSQIFLLVTEQAASLSVSLRVIYKPKILQSSCQYLLLLLDSSLWVKVMRSGYQEDWQHNQQWVVKKLCATWRHHLGASVVFDPLFYAYMIDMCMLMHGISMSQASTVYHDLNLLRSSRCTKIRSNHKSRCTYQKW